MPTPNVAMKMDHCSDTERGALGCGFGFALPRRLFTKALLAATVAATVPVLARDGVNVGERSKFTKLVPASQIEQAAQLQYEDMLQQAGKRRALAPKNHGQVRRLRAIADRIIPFTYEWNERARRWTWEVNLIGSKQINAFCMPGGKIAFYHGILAQLQLNDDEVAMVMGPRWRMPCENTLVSVLARQWPRGA